MVTTIICLAVFTLVSTYIVLVLRAKRRKTSLTRINPKWEI
jgi:hypothetical protein